MAVNTPGFLILFVAILLLYYLLPVKLRVYFLTLASLLFYALWGVSATCLFLIVVFFTYSGAELISKNKNNKAVCNIALFANIAFIAGILLSVRFLPANSFIVCVGLSFFSLQALGYVVDVYKGKTEAETNFLRYLLFLSFFATVTSGPIQRSDVFLRQLHEDKEFDYGKVKHGLLMIAWGLFAKNFVADRLDFITGHAFEGYDTLPGFMLLIAVVVYAFELYCDFYGYSYIALGCAKALGFDLPDNFRRPYLSTSVKEFWSRWHISLSEWLRDYVYFPLGGSRKGKLRTLINIAVTFIVSGIWHGRGLTFLVWGGLHGIFRIFDELTLKKRNAFENGLKSGFARKIFRALSCILTFTSVDFAWLFFRAESLDSALVIIRRIFTESDCVRTIRDEVYTFGLGKKEVAVWFLGLVLILVTNILREKGISLYKWLEKRNVCLRWAVYIAFVLFLMGSGIYYYGYSASRFIYSGF